MAGPREASLEEEALTFHRSSHPAKLANPDEEESSFGDESRVLGPFISSPDGAGKVAGLAGRLSTAQMQ